MDEAENMEAAELEAEASVQSPRQKLLSEIGQKLVLAREARQEQLSIVVHRLKLRESHLLALEGGNWDCLPDDVYALGFLRQYASYLSLDLESEIQRIKNDHYILTRPQTFPDPPVAPSYEWAWVAGTAFVVLFIAFNVLNQDTVQNLLISPKTAPLNAEQTAPASEESSLAANTGAENNPASGNMEEAATESTQETGTASISSTLEAPSEAEQATASDSPPVPETPAESLAFSPVEKSTATLATATASPAIPVLTAEPALPAESEETAGLTGNKPATVHHFRFEAVTESVWLQIFLPDETGQAKGTLYKEVLLQTGQHYSVKEAVDSLWLTCGNPVAMRIKVDEQIQAEVGSLGDVGEVLRDYHFKVARQSSN